MVAKHNRSLEIGAIAWILNLQYFIVQFIAAASWNRVSYSWSNNTISDLANTKCGPYGARFVCSPLHAATNVSFIVAGVTIISGAILLQKGLPRSLVSRAGFGCMASAGLGAVLIGLFPENSVSALHIAGATLSFFLGNLGMILLGVSLARLPTVLRAYTVLSGAIGLLALPLFLHGTYFGLGIGGMERLVSYPQTMWMIVFGVYVLASGEFRPKF